jgi:hypothetical protein
MIRRLAAICILFSLLASPATANEATDPLLDMLARVPDGAIHGGGLVSYVDYRAVESARPGAARPRSSEEWMALRDAGEASFDLWLAAFRAVRSGSGLPAQAFVTAEDWSGVVGFDFFDIDRDLHFGDPPGDGLVLAGTFDQDAIAAAHAARAFTSTDGGDWTLLCGAGGCDEGSAIDLDSREPADPFGGQLGRQQPLLISNEVLLSSAASDTVEAMRDTAEGTRRSLADDPTVRTALAVIPDDATLRQVTLASWLLFVGIEGLVSGAATDEEFLQDDFERFAVELIPQYRLVMLADTATPDEQVTYVALVYDSEDDARSAAAVLPGRIDVLDSIRSDGPLRELFADQGVSDIEVSVHVAPEGSGAATVLALHAPLASSDLTGDSVVPSSLPYRLLVEMVLSRDVLWLATDSLLGTQP